MAGMAAPPTPTLGALEVQVAEALAVALAAREAPRGQAMVVASMFAAGRSI
jgi:hypothetical protein